jgi:hypothetical protein
VMTADDIAAQRCSPRHCCCHCSCVDLDFGAQNTAGTAWLLPRCPRTEILLYSGELAEAGCSHQTQSEMLLPVVVSPQEVSVPMEALEEVADIVAGMLQHHLRRV